MTDWDGILREDEQILWQGRPDGGFRITPRLLPMFLFGVVFMAFAILWIKTAHMVGEGVGGIQRYLPLLAVPLLLMGFWLTIGVHIWVIYLRRHSVYTLTDQRGFIVSNPPLLVSTFESLPVEPDMVSVVERGALADVVFSTRIVQGWSAHRQDFRGSTSARRVPVAFEAVRDWRPLLAALNQVQIEEDDQ